MGITQRFAKTNPFLQLDTDCSMLGPCLLYILLLSLSFPSFRLMRAHRVQQIESHAVWAPSHVHRAAHGTFAAHVRRAHAPRGSPQPPLWSWSSTSLMFHAGSNGLPGGIPAAPSAFRWEELAVRLNETPGKQHFALSSEASTVGELLGFSSLPQKKSLSCSSDLLTM